MSQHKTRWYQQVTMLSTLIAGAGLSACSSTPVPSYYTISPTVAALPANQVKLIELLPVAVPDRLDRSQIVIQDASGKSTMLDNQRWSSALSAELHDGLASGLQQALGAVDRYNSGMAGNQVAYRIATDFSRFDVLKVTTDSSKPVVDRDAMNVNVVVSWIIKRLDPATLPVSASSKSSPDPNRQLSCRMTFSTPVAVHGRAYIPDVVAASQQALNRVVDSMARTVVALDQAVAVPVLPDVSCS